MNHDLDLLLNKDIDLNCVLATFLLTDGCLIGNRICYSTNDVALKNLFCQTILLKIGIEPYTYCDTRTTTNYQIRISHKNLAKELLKLTSFKRAPSKNQTLGSYLSERQPSLGFLLNATRETQLFCIRLAFSTDGYIYFANKKKYYLGLTCYHKGLCIQWAKLTRLCGIENTLVRRSSHWAQYTGLYVRYNSIERFWQIGGFIPGVCVTGKSKSYKGIEKNKLLEEVIWARSLAWRAKFI